MMSLPALLYAAGALTGGITVRRAATWKAERKGWLVLMVSTGLLMALFARS